MRKALLIITVLGFLFSSAMAQADLQTLYAKANDAYNQGDYAGFLKGMQQVDQLRPNHPTILYNLSIAYLKNDYQHQAIRTLERVVWMNTNYPFETDTTFNSIKQNEAFKILVAFKEKLVTPFRSSDIFTKIDKKLITHAEGMTYDQKSGSFFLGDVRDRRIIRVSADGSISDFANGPELLSIMGMDVDEKKGLLWVCSTPMPEMLKREGESAEQNARLLAFDIKTGKLVHTAVAKSKEALFGDLIVAANGDVYTTSSSAAHAAIYKFDSKSGEFKLFRLFGDLVSLQGLTFDAKEENLFFSDYREGLFKLHLESDTRTKLVNYTRQSLKGVDGLYMYKGQLIAVHNGLKPYQLTAYQLNTDQTAIRYFEHLDRALPEMGEPTLGTLVGNTLYYIANSPWPHYDRERNLDPEKLESTVIQKLDLDGALK
ncbi:MAG: hypothetical protein HEP71_08215 [Roseivirga sp.]|nr:hypothetical protein [Roseivirga sp.]